MQIPRSICLRFKYTYMGTNWFNGLYRFSSLFGGDGQSALTRYITVTNLQILAKQQIKKGYHQIKSNLYGQTQSSVPNVSSEHSSDVQTGLICLDTEQQQLLFFQDWDYSLRRFFWPTWSVTGASQSPELWVLKVFIYQLYMLFEICKGWIIHITV